MFVLAEIKDTVRIYPTKFGQDLHDAIVNELNRKRANDVGWSKIEDSLITQIIF